MKLSEKIYYCRKKTGMSQEELAMRLGVSRQAVSKWETGDAEPETGKLRSLAESLGVTVDWLLSDDDPIEKPLSENDNKSRTESLVGSIQSFVKRYGWVLGVYIALCGAAMAAFGILAHLISSWFKRTAAQSFGGFSGYAGLFGASGGQAFLNGSNPVEIIGTAFIIIGAVLIVFGLVLAVILKKRGK